MVSRAACMLLTTARLSSAVGRNLESSVCGGVHCFGTSVYCCTNELGEQSCCQKSVYQELWFWAVLVIGLLVVAAVLFCSCRALYRYHNAGQYTKLRLQQPDSYGSISCTIASVSMPPPRISSSDDDCDQLPSYASVMNMPPAYSEVDTGR